MSAYETLETRFADLSILYQVSTILHWDGAVMMPTGGAEARAGQLAMMASLQHARLTNPEIGDLLEQSAGETLGDWQAANLREMRRDYNRARAVPADLVDAYSRATSACEHRWREAKQADDYAAVLPLFQTVVDLTRDRAAALGAALNLSPYDALLDGFEPDLRAADIDPVFDAYAAFLPSVLDDILARQAAAGPAAPPTVDFPIDKQKALVRDLAETVGFDFEQGRVDESAHPFSTGYAGDRRITTGFREEDPGFAIMAVLHETGHSIYEQNLPADWCNQPVGQARGMALHESQSLLIEMQACRSDAFLSYLGPKLARAFGDDAAFEPGNLGRRYRHVDRSLIRPMSSCGHDWNGRSCPAIWRWRICPARGPTVWKPFSASARRTTGAAACRISTGMTAASAISRPIRWARWRRRNCFRRRRRRIPKSSPDWNAATFPPCGRGCGKTSIGTGRAIQQPKC